MRIIMLTWDDVQDHAWVMPKCKDYPFMWVAVAWDVSGMSIYASFGYN